MGVRAGNTAIQRYGSGDVGCESAGLQDLGVQSSECWGTGLGVLG